MIVPHVQGTGSFLPGEPISNDDLMQLFGRAIKPLCAAIGVQRRYWAADPRRGWQATGVNNSTMAARAASLAIADAGLSPADVDLLVMVTATPDYPFPATVTLVQEELGIAECVALEFRAACAGVAQALAVAELFIRSGRARTALVIGSEVSSSLIDFRTSGTPPDDVLLSAVMFGDGAGALLLAGREASQPADGIFTTVLNSVGAGRAPGFQCRLGGSRHPYARVHEVPDRSNIVHDFRQILTLGPQLVLRAFHDLQRATALSPLDFDVIVPPQANPALTRSTMASQGLDDTRVFYNVHRVGNTSSASLLIALDELNRTGRLAPGHRVALLAAEASKWLYGAAALTWTRARAASAAA